MYRLPSQLSIWNIQFHILKESLEGGRRKKDIQNLTSTITSGGQIVAFRTPSTGCAIFSRGPANVASTLSFTTYSIHAITLRRDMAHRKHRLTSWTKEPREAFLTGRTRETGSTRARVGSGANASARTWRRTSGRLKVYEGEGLRSYTVRKPGNIWDFVPKYNGSIIRPKCC